MSCNLVLYYNTSDPENYVSQTKLTDLSSNVISRYIYQKNYKLRNKNNELKGLLNIIDNGVIYTSTPNQTNLLSNYTITLFCKNGTQLYSVVYSSIETNKESVVLNMKLTSVDGNSMFSKLRWEIPYVDGQPKTRVLTFSK